MLTKTGILKTIQRNTDQLKKYGVGKIGIFGSFVNATQTGKSDIDILVEFAKENSTFDNYMELKFYLERLFHRKVDLVMKGALKSRIRNRVLSDVEYA
ncbi:MAG: nucleotidyltransferase family protein [Candidatus Omnitrophica bacterium]|nr:nucleotidyltransferase family protein [Candidatus Omnitrophota bacterium]